MHDFFGIGSQAFDKIALFFIIHQRPINAVFRRQRRFCIRPVQGTLDFTAGIDISRLGKRIIRADDFRNIALRIFLNPFAFDDIGIFEAYFSAYVKAEIFFVGRNFHKVALVRYTVRARN